MAPPMVALQRAAPRAASRARSAPLPEPTQTTPSTTTGPARVSPTGADQAWPRPVTVVGLSTVSAGLVRRWVGPLPSWAQSAPPDGGATEYQPRRRTSTFGGGGEDGDATVGRDGDDLEVGRGP